MSEKDGSIGNNSVYNKRLLGINYIIGFIVLVIAMGIGSFTLAYSLSFRDIDDSNVLGLSTTLQIGVSIIVVYKYIYLDGEGKSWDSRSRQLIGHLLILLFIFLIFAASAERQLMIIGRGELDSGDQAQNSIFRPLPDQVNAILSSVNASDIFYFLSLVGFLTIAVLLSRGLNGVSLLAQDNRLEVLRNISRKYDQLVETANRYYFDRRVLFGPNGEGKIKDKDSERSRWRLEWLSKQVRYSYIKVFGFGAVGQFAVAIGIVVFTKAKISDTGWLFGACFSWILGLALFYLMCTRTDLLEGFAQFSWGGLFIILAYLQVSAVFDFRPENAGLLLGAATASFLVGCIVDVVVGKRLFHQNHPLELKSDFVENLVSGDCGKGKGPSQEGSNSPSREDSIAFQWVIEPLDSASFARSHGIVVGGIGVVSRHSKLFHLLSAVQVGVRGYGEII